VDFAARGRLLDAGLAALRRAWDSADAPDAEDRYRQLPAAPKVPVWVGGSSAAARRRAAAVGDGWVPLFLEPGELAAGFAQLRRDTEDAGRDPATVVPATVVPVCVGTAGTAAERGTRWLSSLYRIPPKAFARHLVAGTASHCATEIERYLDAGALHVVVMVADDSAVEHFTELASALDARIPARAPAPLEVMA
jgi:alkanesulfonate monooxygenase SsuD/methylene tetrahydromethanopterin reductase-like flavin-dependent oxidoreductase (luciferase family)